MGKELRDLRILMFPRTMAMGGTEKVVLQLCRSLRDRVAYLGVASCGGELVGELDAMGVPHFDIPDITEKNPVAFMKIAVELGHVARENDINLVHCHHRMAAFYSRLVFPRTVGIVATAHNVFHGEKAATRFLYRDMHIVACGGRVYENLVDYYGLPVDSVKLIPNSVPRFNGDVCHIPEIDACPDGVFKVGFIGRLTKAKGVVFLVDALALLVERGVPVRCFIVGEGDLGDELHKRAACSAAARNIVFLGLRNDSQNFLSQMDVCVIPSLWEGLPLVALEAFSVGTPVIASATDGLLDVVRDGSNGLLARPGDAQTLANCIERLCKDAELTGLIGERAFADYETEYSYESWVEKYFDFYRGFCDEWKGVQTF